MNDQYDIVIHGAGIPGMALALLLSRTNLVQANQSPSILLLDRKFDEPDAAIHEVPASVADIDTRVFALTYASRDILKDAGVWPGDDAPRVYPYERMHVWDSGVQGIVDRGEIHFDAAEVGTASLGYIVEGRVMQDWLMCAVRRESRIDIMADESLVDSCIVDESIELYLESGKRIHTCLLVGADGASSRVRELAGIETIGWSYGQQAVVATVQTEQDHQRTAWQRFLPEGPLAFLPMQSPYCSIVWTVSDDRAAWLCDIAEDEFMEELGRDFQYTLGSIVSVGPRARFPLRLSHARSYIAPRIALVADAAHTVHPLAGQGLNLGLLDVAVLANRLIQARAAGRDMGSRPVLRSYERSRKGDNWQMQLSFDGLKRLFSTEQVLLARIRVHGLNQVNRITSLKNFFVRKAMGLMG